jgi:hypothetical protein
MKKTLVLIKPDASANAKDAKHELAL